MPPTSIASERVIGTVGDVLTNKSNHLLPDNDEKFLIMKEKLLKFCTVIYQPV